MKSDTVYDRKDVKVMKRKKITGGILSIFMAASLMVPAAAAVPAYASGNSSGVYINEIESDDPDGGSDWIEIINAGTKDVDISGWFVTDDKGLERLTENKTKRLGADTVLKAGELLVLEDTIDFDFGLGKADTVSLYNSESKVEDTYSYTSHASGTYSRVPDGTGEFKDQEATKNKKNTEAGGSGGTGGSGEEEPGAKDPFVINEVNSSPDDWVELINTSNKEIDISGYEIRDNSDDHRWRFPEGTKVKAGEIITVDAGSKGLVYDDKSKTYEEGTFESAIGIGSGDSIRIYDKNGDMTDKCTWTEHAAWEGDAAKASIGRYPDGTGDFCIMKETKGSPNEWYKPEVVINEVESDNDSTDWVEIMNTGKTTVDISGWYLYDNDPEGHRNDIKKVADGTVLKPGEFYVFDQNTDFTFGLGKADSVTVYNKSGVVIAEYEWTEHAAGVYARIPDGTGELVDFAVSTKGKANVAASPVVINEVQSDDKNGGPDWIELANPSADEIDISGIVIKDSDDTHEYIIADGTKIPAKGFIVIKDLSFGLGKNDSVRLYEKGRLIAKTEWTGDTDPSWGLYPDVNGSEYRKTKEETPGAANKFAGIPEVEKWPGPDDVKVYDTDSVFLEDSSGLDFHNGRLYAVDNGTATFWVLDVAKDGSMKFASGFEKGKRVHYIKDSGNLNAKGPDAEGITVDENGMVYLAAERDNSRKGVNFDSILMVDPDTEGTDLVASKEWDLTSSLPDVSANMGIEAVEWVSADDINGKLIDQNTGKQFDISDYPDAHTSGIFFVALEDNGHVYGYVLNKDGSCVQISDTDTKLGGAMALDYDRYEGVLWASADDGYGNKASKIRFNGSSEPDITHVLPPAGVNVTANNEGFAIAESDFTVNGTRPVYRFCDGVTSGALTVGSMYTDKGNKEDPEPGKNNNNSNKPGTENNGQGQKGTAPQTGDNTDIQIWIMIALISAGCLMICMPEALKKKK